MAFKPTYVRRKTYIPLYINNLSYIIILETEINFQNDVTFVLVKLDKKFKVQIS